MTARIIDGAAVARGIREGLKGRVEKLKAEGRRAPCLAVILVGNDPASEIYVGHKKKACAEVGIESLSFHLPGDIAQTALAEQLQALSADPKVDGILLQLPLPKHLNSQAAIDLIAAEKDVDGLSPVNQGLIVWRRPGLVPCTPLGVMELIRTTGVDLNGKRAVVIGRSVLVGAPVATLLASAGATVTGINSKTVHPEEICRSADVLVVAAGAKRLVKGSWIKPGAVVIDVGMHRDENGLCGDVAFDEAKEVASWITPVPKGVGPMTIACLLQNCVKAYELREGIRKETKA